MVERLLAKEKVAGSIPVSRSFLLLAALYMVLFIIYFTFPAVYIMKICMFCFENKGVKMSFMTRIIHIIKLYIGFSIIVNES